MNNDKKKVSIGTLIWAMVLVFVITAGACGWFFRVYSPTDAAGVKDRSFAHKVSEINSILEENYLNPEGETDINYDMMEDIALFTYVRGLGDPYSYYTNAEGMALQREDRAGHFTGIGVTATATDDDLIEIIEVYDNSPAQQAGILVGDIITEVDGTSVYEVGFENGVDLVLGEADTDVSLVIMRDGEEIPLVITRKTINLDSVTYRMLGGDIAYIRIRSFNDVTYEGFKKALDALSEMSADGAPKGIIFDLRNNTGGSLEAIVSVLDEILPEGDIVKLVDKEGSESVYTSDASEIDLPMCVVVNESTASAAELFAGSLRDYDKAKIVGTTTYGKGCAISTYPLSDGGAISIVTEMFYSASGTNFEGTGIEPDVVVEMPGDLRRHMFAMDETEDPQLRAAFEILRGQ
ncbi:MAG: S41 family peptidase [Clostridia bacterium]|nr:S41 family peptidase [Clostridia bacterium]